MLLARGSTPTTGFVLPGSDHLPFSVHDGTGRYGLTYRLTIEAHGGRTRRFALALVGATTKRADRIELGPSPDRL